MPHKGFLYDETLVKKSIALGPIHKTSQIELELELCKIELFGCLMNQCKNSKLNLKLNFFIELWN